MNKHSFRTPCPPCPPSKIAATASLTLCPRCHSEPQAKNLAFVTVRKTRCFAALSMTSLPYAPFSSSRGERKLMVHFVVKLSAQPIYPSRASSQLE